VRHGEKVGGGRPISGRSLRRHFATGADGEGPRPFFAVLEHGESKAYAIQRESWKLIFRADERQATPCDLNTDPGEKINAAHLHQDVFESPLELHQERMSAVVTGAGDERDRATRAAREAELRAIGYVE